jgi:hypothetical protein
VVQNTNDSKERIIDLLYSMPDWSSFAASDKESEWRCAIERSMECIVKQRPEDIEAVVIALTNNDLGRPIDSGARESALYLLTKYFFDLPDSVRRDDPHFGAFVSGGYQQPFWGEPLNPQPSDQLKGRWPWSVDADGKWRLTGTFEGAMGPPFDPVKSFQYFREHFGVRRFED